LAFSDIDEENDSILVFLGVMQKIKEATLSPLDVFFFSS